MVIDEKLTTYLVLDYYTKIYLLINKKNQIVIFPNQNKGDKGLS